MTAMRADHLQFILNEEPTDNFLPPYAASISESSSTLQTPHTYFYPGTKAPWVSLTLLSRAADSSSLPLYAKHDTIRGYLDLNLTDSKLHIRWIGITIEGKITSPSGSEKVFWLTTKPIYVYDPCDPTCPKRSHKLKQIHSFPVSVPLPGTVYMKFNRHSAVINLPPTHDGKSIVSYRFQVVIERGLFRSTIRFGTQLTYSPRLRAPWPRLASLICSPLSIYSESTDSLDPELWKSISQVEIKGVLCNRQVQLTYRLAIARPLVVSRGSTVLVLLSISSTDTEALAFFSSPSSPLVGLVQIESWSQFFNGTSQGFRDVHSVASSSRWACVPKIQTSLSGCDTVKSLSIIGEIHVPDSLAPSFDIAGNGIEHAVYLFPPRAPGFVLQSPISGPLASQSIKVVTDSPRGLLSSHSFLPPSYCSEESIEKERQDLEEMDTYLLFWRKAWYDNNRPTVYLMM